MNSISKYISMKSTYIMVCSLTVHICLSMLYKHAYIPPVVVFFSQCWSRCVLVLYKLDEWNQRQLYQTLRWLRMRHWYVRLSLSQKPVNDITWPYINITLKWFWRALSLVWEPTWAVWSLKWLFEARACEGFKLSLKASKSLRRFSNKMIVLTKIILLLLIIHRSPPYVGFN